jgi:hypothetical protein
VVFSADKSQIVLERASRVLMRHERVDQHLTYDEQMCSPVLSRRNARAGFYCAGL